MSFPSAASRRRRWQLSVRARLNIILPAENKQNVEEDLTPERTPGDSIFTMRAKTIEELLQSIALPTTTAEVKHDEQVGEQVLQTIACRVRTAISKGEGHREVALSHLPKHLLHFVFCQRRLSPSTKFAGTFPSHSSASFDDKPNRRTILPYALRSRSPEIGFTYPLRCSVSSSTVDIRSHRRWQASPVSRFCAG